MLHINGGLISIGGRGLGDLEIRYQFGFGCGRNLRDTVTTDRCRIVPRGRTAVIEGVGITRGIIITRRLVRKELLAIKIA